MAWTSFRLFMSGGICPEATRCMRCDNGQEIRDRLAWSRQLNLHCYGCGWPFNARKFKSANSGCPSGNRRSRTGWSDSRGRTR
jgi:hypothetical protein